MIYININPVHQKIDHVSMKWPAINGIVVERSWAPIKEKVRKAKILFLPAQKNFDFKTLEQKETKDSGEKKKDTPPRHGILSLIGGKYI